MGGSSVTIYARFDERGFAIGFWDTDFVSDESVIPPEVIEINCAQRDELLVSPATRRWKNGVVVEMEPYIATPQIIIVPAVTLWERLTESEADQVNEAMQTQSIRTQRIFTTANTFRSDHELWTILEQMATELFGEDRAAALLANPL